MANIEKALLKDLLEQETLVWEALRQGDAAADLALLSPAFLGVYPDGFAGQKDHIAQLTNGPAILSFQMRQARVLPLGNEHAVLSYRADFTRAGRVDVQSMYVSSIWQRSGTSWINVFSQDTPATDGLEV